MKEQGRDYSKDCHKESGTFRGTTVLGTETDFWISLALKFDSPGSSHRKVWTLRHSDDISR